MTIIEQNLYAILVLVKEDLLVKIIDTKAAAADYFLSDLTTGVFHATEVKINYGFYKLSDNMLLAAVKEMPTSEIEIFDIVEDTLNILSESAKYIESSETMTLDELARWRPKNEPSSTIN